MTEEPSAQAKFAQTRHQQYRTFIESYTDGAAKPHYLQLINDAVKTKRYFVPINMQTVYSLFPNLYHDTIKYIDEMIPVIGDCVCQIAIEENPKEDPDEIDNNMKV